MGYSARFCDEWQAESSLGYNGFVDNKTELDPEDDAATANWGEMWRMPSDDQLYELNVVCVWQWTMRNGVNGYLVTSNHNGASLFLPAAGFHWNGGLSNAGAGGFYWSRTLYSGTSGTRPYNAYSLYFYSYGVFLTPTTGATVEACELCVFRRIRVLFFLMKQMWLVCIYVNQPLFC